MITNIFVNNNNTVENYLVEIDITKLTQIKTRIDFWHGKGPILKHVGRSITYPENKKVEIISKKQISYEEKKDECFGNKNRIPIYEYTYYAYNRHELSKICNHFIERTKREKEKHQISFSQCLKFLLNFNPSNENESDYFYEILSCFKFEKYTTEEIIKSDLNLNEKKSILSKLKIILKKSSNLEDSVFMPKSYITLIEEKIKMREFISSQRALRTVIYSDRHKNEIKKNIFYSLPEKEELEKHNLIK